MRLRELLKLIDGDVSILFTDGMLNPITDSLHIIDSFKMRSVDAENYLKDTLLDTEVYCIEPEDMVTINVTVLMKEE